MKNVRREPFASAALDVLGRVSVTSDELHSHPQRACPVCCRCLGRDREMIVLCRRSSKWWVCKSNFEDEQPCGFAFRCHTNQRYVDARAREQAKRLQVRPAGVTPAVTAAARQER